MPQQTIPSRPPANDEEVRANFLAQLTGYWLRRASNTMTGDFAEAMQGTGMRPVLVSILSVIEENPGLNQGQLGRALGIQRANMVTLVGGLMNRDLIARHDVPGDRRAFALHLTPAGQDMLDECRRRLLAHEERMLSILSAEERALFLDLLKRVEAQGQ